MTIFEATKFCIVCGGESIGEKNYRTCKKCGIRKFINPSPATGAIIIRDHKFLLTRRAHEPAKGTWDIPGGFTEPGETFEQSITREIFEEMGVNATSIKYFNSQYDYYEYDGIVDNIIVVNFLVEVDSFDFKPDDDITETKFFGEDEVPYGDIKFPSVSNTIKEYFKLHQS
ncbi:MAG TPA: NUDIX domain-containing protein [Candidatus Dojkabacteria bacterium]|nr:NUDIX domain-containing protein [Candidatus Dojkabacteria bacterium]HRO64821.1 NUDIX domain-containing protein [Candidatus Dojkabacteria bacterium]HRP51254.1 NUDIX domain-containing protein [Candidatus Dojkabacteria bacterium]